MNHRDLLDKLLQIERAIGVESNLAVREMIMNAEECLLKLEKARVEELCKNAGVSILSGYQPEASFFTLRSEPRDSTPATANSQVAESTLR
jgi:hypothetical protein